MEEKLIRDALGSPVPQYLNLDLQMFAVQTLDGSTVTAGDMDFSKTKLLRDKLGSVIPQVWDAGNHKWTVVTSNGGSSGEISPVTWESIQDKPVEFMPNTHTHNISEISGLQEKLDELWAAIGMEPEPEPGPGPSPAPYPELEGKSWTSNGTHYAVIPKGENFYVDGIYVRATVGFDLYRVSDDALVFDGSYNSAFNFTDKNFIIESNVDIYTDSTFTAVFFEANYGD